MSTPLSRKELIRESVIARERLLHGALAALVLLCDLPNGRRAFPALALKLNDARARFVVDRLFWSPIGALHVPTQHVGDEGYGPAATNAAASKRSANAFLTALDDRR